MKIITAIGLFLIVASVAASAFVRGGYRHKMERDPHDEAFVG